MRYQPRAPLAILASFTVACATDPTSPEVTATAAATNVIAESGQASGAHLVNYRAGRRAQARAAIEAAGGRVVREIAPLSMLQVTGLGSATSVQSIATSASVAAVSEDRQVFAHPRVAPQRAATVAALRPSGRDQSSAFFYPLQWNLRSTSAHTAWAPSGGGAGKLVCILDTGIDPGHLDLAGKVDMARTIPGILIPRFQSDLTPLDYDFHGTFTAGMVTSNGIGVASVAPEAQLCSIKVLSQDGRGTFSDVLFGIVQAADWNADAINLSLGAVLDVREPIFANLIANLQAAIDYAVKRGSLVVAASGNLGVNFDEVPARLMFVPAMLPNVLSVGATAPYNQSGFDQLASYSNHGGVRTVDMVAPGGDFLPGGVTEDLLISACSQYAQSLPFTCSSNSFLFASGTSFASPMVAGAAAVVESSVGNLTPSNLETCLKSSSDRVGSKWLFGSGRLNVLAALSCS